MDYLVLMKVLKCLTDRKCELAGHGHRNRLKLASFKHLLQVATLHSLHYDTMHVFMSEVLFEAHNVGAVLATGLQGALTVDLCKASLTHAFGIYELHSKSITGQFVLHKHDLSGAALSKQLLHLILIELIFKSLRVQKHSQTFLLILLTVEVKKARTVWICVQLHWVDDRRAQMSLDRFFGGFLRLG